MDSSDLKAPPQGSWDPDPTRVVRCTAKPGETIIKQGDQGDVAYLIEEGEVAIIQTVGGHRIELGTARKGQMFGEMAVIDSGRRMASAIALTEVKLLRIPRADFDRRLEASDRVVRNILKMFLDNIRGASNIFLRRPRSFRDKIYVLEEVADYIESYRNSLQGQQPAALDAKIEALKALVEDFKAMAPTLPEPQQHAILEIGEHVTPPKAANPNQPKPFSV